jgi:hypothetical protein
MVWTLLSGAFGVSLKQKSVATRSHIPSEAIPRELEPGKEARSKELVMPDVH